MYMHVTLSKLVYLVHAHHKSAAYSSGTCMYLLLFAEGPGVALQSCPRPHRRSWRRWLSQRRVEDWGGRPRGWPLGPRPRCPPELSPCSTGRRSQTCTGSDTWCPNASSASCAVHIQLRVHVRTMHISTYTCITLCLHNVYIHVYVHSNYVKEQSVGALVPR